MPSQTFFNLPEQKRETLIEIALDEFSTQDYNSASVSRIVKEAGIAKGSFYQYFQDKKDLYLYLLNLVSEAKISLLQHTPPPKAKMDFFEYLGWLFDMSICFDRTHPVLSRLAYRAFYGNSSFQDSAIDEIEEASSNFMRQIIIEGVESGDIDPKIDLDLAVFVVDTLINAFNNYIPKKLDTTTDTLAQEGALSFDTEASRDIFNELLDILRFGLTNHRK